MYLSTLPGRSPDLTNCSPKSLSSCKLRLYTYFKNRYAKPDLQELLPPPHLLFINGAHVRRMEFIVIAGSWKYPGRAPLRHDPGETPGVVERSKDRQRPHS